MSDILTIPPQQIADLRKTLEKAKDQISKAISEKIDPEIMARLVLTAALKNPDLFKCTRQSIALAMLRAAQIGIMPDDRHGYLIPYKNKRANCMEAQFMPSYRGLLRIALENPGIQAIKAEVVRAGDFFDYELGFNERCAHRKATEERGELTHAYCVIHYENGGKTLHVMTRAEVQKRRDKAQTQGVWTEWEDEMWRKTVLKAACNQLPSGEKLTRALQQDNEAETGQFTPAAGETLNLGSEDAEPLGGAGFNTERLAHKLAGDAGQSQAAADNEG